MQMSRLFEMMRKTELYGFQFSFEPVHKYWKTYWDIWSDAVKNDARCTRCPRTARFRCGPDGRAAALGAADIRSGLLPT